MNEIQEYLFENSSDIKEIHYINLMNMCLRIHNNVPTITNITNNIHNIYNTNIMNRRVDIFDYSSNDLDNEVNFFTMVRSKLNLEANENIIGTDLYFPASLSSSDRQAIHIFTKMACRGHPSDYISSESFGHYDHNRRICVHFSADFLLQYI